MRAINLSSKLRPSAYRSVTEMVFTSSQKVIKPFCLAQFIFLTWKRMSCLRQKVNDRGKIRQSPVVTDNGRQSFPVGPGASAMDRRRTKFARIKIELEQFQPSHLKI